MFLVLVIEGGAAESMALHVPLLLKCRETSTDIFSLREECGTTAANVCSVGAPINPCICWLALSVGLSVCLSATRDAVLIFFKHIVNAAHPCKLCCSEEHKCDENAKLAALQRLCNLGRKLVKLLGNMKRQLRQHLQQTRARTVKAKRGPPSLTTPRATLSMQ